MDPLPAQTKPLSNWMISLSQIGLLVLAPLACGLLYADNRKDREQIVLLVQQQTLAIERMTNVVALLTDEMRRGEYRPRTLGSTP